MDLRTFKLDDTWHISEEGNNLISKDLQRNTVEEKFRAALNLDLKDICKPFLAEQVQKNRVVKSVLQIQKIRNVAAPKANEFSQAAPRMLKLTLTDGRSYVQALELSPIPALKCDKSLIGGKLLVKDAEVFAGYLLLNGNNCAFLGTKQLLKDKLEEAHLLPTDKSASDGPPAWVKFGCPIPKQHYEITQTKKEVKENAEFEQQRKDAIAKVASGAIPKVSLNKPVNNTRNYSTNPVNTNNTRPPKREPRTRKFQEKEFPEKLEKPTEKLSLFDFVTNKLGPNENNTKTHVPQDRTGKKQYNRNTNYTRNNRDNVDALSDNLSQMTFNNKKPYQTEQLKNVEHPTHYLWTKGAHCMAKWRDGKYYNANIVDTTIRTCIVQFKGYGGNTEEVLKSDCLPVSE